MGDLLSATLVAFGVVFVAELGDKTQLLALGFGSRYSLRQVGLGLLVGYGSGALVAIAIGGLLGATFPQRPIEIVGGIIFLLFALISWREAGRHAEEDPGEPSDSLMRSARSHHRFNSSAVAAIGLAIFVAEIGDKTQIASATLASRGSPIGTWIGATLGATASGMIGAVAGNMISDRIAPRTIGRASAGLFALFGALMLLGWF